MNIVLDSKAKLRASASDPIMPMIPMDAFRTRNEVWESISSFFQHPWFDRAWTFQEAIVSRRANIMYGDTGLTWSSVLAFVRAVSHHDLSLFRILTQPTKMLAFDRADKIFNRHGRLSLAPLMFSRRCCGATNPRDIVYAHLGLTNIMQTEIPIDYSMPVEQVYANTTKTLIIREDNLDALVAVHHNERNQDMPSWAIDWRVPNECNPIATLKVHDELRDQMHQQMYCAGGERVITEQSDWRSLILKGVHVTRVSKIFTPSFQDPHWTVTDTLPPECAEWFRQLVDTVENINKRYPLVLESYLEAFSRTIIADQDKFTSWTDHRAKQNFSLTFSSLYESKGSNFRPLLRTEDCEGMDRRNLLEYRYTSRRVCFNRILFMGENGCIGLAPRHTKVGDDIVVLFGGETPFVLRPAEKHHEFVGEVYCHGIMDGEIRTRRPLMIPLDTVWFTLK